MGGVLAQHTVRFKTESDIDQMSLLGVSPIRVNIKDNVIAIPIFTVASKVVTLWRCVIFDHCLLIQALNFKALI